MTTVHVCGGGPKTWGFQIREKGRRKCEYHGARSEAHARQCLFSVMALNPKYVEGYVVFSQEYYDPSVTVRVRVTRGEG